MPYIVDGHNLIGHLADLKLDDPEDEARMAARLKAFCLRSGKKVIVYFDCRSPASQDPPTSSGLTIHFTPGPRTADDAIRDHLARLGKEAPNWTIVSSDRAVRDAAQHAKARVLSCSEFARLLQPYPALPSTNKALEKEGDMEIEYWTGLFRRGRPKE